MTTYNDRNTKLMTSASRITGASVSITNNFGNQLLVPKNSAVPYPQNIQLTAVTSKYFSPQYVWSYKIGTGPYNPLGSTTATISLTLDATWLTAVGTNTTVTYKVEVTETAGSYGVNATQAEFVVPVIREGLDGTSAWNNVPLRIYRRNSVNSAPELLTTGNSVYTFSSGTLIGVPANWSTTVPSVGGEYVFTAEYTAVSQTNSVTFANTNWSTPALFVKDGTPGATGNSGVVVYAYKRSANVPTDNPGQVVYSFTTNTITTDPLDNSWSKSIPSGTDPLYAVTATASSNSGTDTILSGEWSSPVELARNGTAGTNVATVYLYARNNNSASAPTFVTSGLSELVFDFSQGSLSGIAPTNWYLSPPDVSLGSVLWLKTAVAFGTGTTDNIAWLNWSEAKILSVNGANGTPGAAGANGTRGSRTLYSSDSVYNSNYTYGGQSAGANSYAAKATELIAAATVGSVPTTPINGDTVTFSNGSTYVFTITHNGTSWQTPGVVIDGSLLVTGSVTAAKINSTGLTIRDSQGNVILSAGDTPVNLNSSYITPAGGWLNSNVQVNSSGALTGIGTGSGTIVNNQLVESTKLIASGNVTVSGTSIISSTAPGTWGTAQVYSSEGYAGGAYASFTVKTVGADRSFMAGLNTASDLTDGGYASIDFAFYFEGVNLLTIYESGNWVGNFGTFADGDTFAIVYDGFQIFYYKNGSVVRTKTQTVTQKLFFDSAIATASSTPLLTNIKFSPLPSTSTAKNFADTSWWTWQDVNSNITTQYGVQWIPNSGTNKITTSRDALINQPSPLAGVSSDFVWYLTEPDASNNAGGGWDANLNHALDPTKTYRFVVPVMRLSGGEISGQVYWGTYDVCDLNTVNTNTNPYFCSVLRSSLVENRWYLMVGYVFPYGSTNNTHEGAGLIDTTTGLYVVGGTNWAHTSIGASIHRAYQYYASAGNRQVFGRPEIYEVNGTEPPLSRYMTLAKTMNASINVDSNGVLKNAGNEALVGNSAIALSISSTGTLSATGGPSTAGAVTIRGLGFVGDLGATSGKSLSPPLSNWNLGGTNPLETISDGKVGNQAVRLTTAGNIINAPVYVPLDRSKIYRTRFWARPVNTDGLLYFALRQFKDTNGTTGDTNSGFSPYKPGGVSQATHNNIYGAGQWGEYTYTWSSADWQAGVYFLLPTFLWNYTGNTGYWEIQDFTFEEVTEVVTAQANIDDKLSKSTANILSSTISVNAVTGAGFRAGNLTWNSAGTITSGAGNPGVAMTPGGLIGVNSSGTTTFSINASTGAAFFSGDLNVKSASSGARTEITNSVIKVYDANGVLRVKLGDLSA